MEYIMSTLAIICAIIAFIVGRKQGQKLELEEQTKANQAAAQIIENAHQEVQRDRKVELLETKEMLRALEVEKKAEFDAIRAKLEKKQSEINLEMKEIVFREETLKEHEGAYEKNNEKLHRAQTDFDKYVLETSTSLEEKIVEIANLSPEDARGVILDRTKAEMTRELSAFIRAEEDKAKYKIKQRSKNFLVQAMQKYSAEVATERTVSVVALPSDDLKGRLIGREGRNIRSIETLTGVDVIIDDTPEAIVLSCFDPIRRELARMLVQELVDDGRIHPGRIEEVYKQKNEELDAILVEYGEQTLVEMNLPTMEEEILKLIGKLHFRTSYGQNILQHSKEVGYLAGVLASELGEDIQLAKYAGLMHDIGKAVDFETEGTHVELGMKIAKKFRMPNTVHNAIASHHGDNPATSVIAELVAIADSMSATRPGARRESLESYIKRLSDLEDLTTSFKGVQKSYAIQAGREVRIIVNPETMNDDQTVVLSHDIKQKIEENLQYPGTIKVTVIRETRAIDIAK